MKFKKTAQASLFLTIVSAITVTTLGFQSQYLLISAYSTSLSIQTVIQVLTNPFIGAGLILTAIIGINLYFSEGSFKLEVQ